MSVFEDTVELWQNALEDDDVATVEGPASIETLLEARDRFEQLGNEPRDGCLVISIDMAREIPRGWVEIDGPAVPDGHEEFRPFERMVTVTDRVGGEVAFICRSDAVRLDMTVLEADGVVAIDFDRGDTTDA
ncbi:hypothetical protein NP511_01985 [Natrinema thermotolerans]|uniref:Uncharacterized protein n=1 Tax=Natrinema thermotolerans TaxID=121872 RepID=A0AAF0PC00_9EURY|nr:hypothetical protein [Natrinema thermotolerans]WPH65831.1 hypothetical protein HJTV4_gp7 [Haloarchaeal virus HJTV-4]QCC60736.1 hypothetical protein DVR14_19680 [Natrinema thermotolerans]QCC61614.1 hypothetical protein DVR14_23810 [Natrinema thermotolerans]WMT07780.1 hypothetical protein NP511_20700 [Natrinema thermotolerans]WMT08412.1 hypothetical protein NP511_01985 [Natrinema thermotolerans]